MQSERLDVILGLISKHANNSGTRNVLLVGCGSDDDMSLDPSAFGIDRSLQSLRNTKTRFNSSKSWYGLAQWTAEKISGNPVTAAGQPIDRWSTLENLKDKITPEFNLLEAKGIWYYPPMGKGYAVLPFTLSAI